jgi:hypothetical protein
MKKFFTLLLSILAGCTMAQNAFNNKGVLIKNTSTIKVRNGDVRTDPTSVVVNYGTISFTNDWINTGLVTSNGGTEECSGDTNQIVSGIYGGSNFTNFKRSQTSGKNVILPTDFVCYTMNLGNNPGTINASINPVKVDIISSLYNAITNYSSTNYINIGDAVAEVRRFMKDTVSGHWYVVPVGNYAIGYYPIEFNLQTIPSDTMISVQIINGPPPNNAIYISKSYSTACFTFNHIYELSCMKDNSHKIFGPDSGTYIMRVITPICVSGGTGYNRVLVTPNGLPDWVPQFDTSIVGDVPTALCLYSNTSGSDTIPGGPYKGFNKRAAVTGSPSLALPVELLGIYAEAIANKYIHLTWATASEKQCKEFEIERSLTGADWISIGTVAGNGTTSYRHDYYFDDFDVVPNLYYYRLKQVDLDGTFSYSYVVTAKIIGVDIVIGNIYPNPNNGQFLIDMYLPNNETVSVTCYDIIGQELFAYDTPFKNGSQQLNINHILAKGTYILNLFIDGVSYVKKFVVE